MVGKLNSVVVVVVVLLVLLVLGKSALRLLLVAVLSVSWTLVRKSNVNMYVPHIKTLNTSYINWRLDPLA